MSDWEPIPKDEGGWEPIEPIQDISRDYEPSPLETGLAAMAPKGLTSALYGIKEAVPAGLEKGFEEGLTTYRRERDQARKDLEASEARNPRAAMVGSVAPYAVVPATGIPGAMAIGGATSAIDSKADLTKISDPKELRRFSGDVATGMALGGAFGAAGRYAPKTTSALAGGAMAGELIAPGEGAIPGAAAGLALRGATSPVVRNYLLKKFNNSFLDVPEAVSERYLKDPKKVMSSKSPDLVGQDIADTFGRVKSELGELSGEAMSKLSDERTPGVMGVNDAVKILSQFDDPTAKKMADDLMVGYQQRAGGISPVQNAENLTEIEVHRLKKLLQGFGEWNSPIPSSEKAQANYTAGKVNKILKGSNQEYAELMGELSQGINTKNELAKKFGIVPDYTGQNPSGFTYSDRTVQAMKDVVRANKFDRARILRELKEQGYGDIADKIQDSLAKQVLTGPGATAGSRKAVVGANIGTAVGAGIGGAIGGGFGATAGALTGRAVGSAVGAVADKYGPKVGKKLLDANSVINRLQAKTGNSKFLAPLRAAAQRGDNSFAATYFLMSHAEPDFRKAMEDEPGE